MLARSALALILSVLAGACAPLATPPATPSPVTGGPVPFDVLATGQAARYDKAEPALAALPDASDFGRWWSEAIGQGDPSVVGQSISFSQEIAIGVLLGRRSTGGYGIEIQAIRHQGTDLVVVVKTRSPPPGGLVPQVITSPYQVIKIGTRGLPNWRQLRYVMQDTTGAVLAEMRI